MMNTDMAISSLKQHKHFYVYHVPETGVLMFEFVSKFIVHTSGSKIVKKLNSFYNTPLRKFPLHASFN
jgi:hypothetical protein